MRDPSCKSWEHEISRRRFLGMAAGAAGMLGFGSMMNPLAARQLQSQDKRVLLVYLAGGVSQLESWDPKPGTDTGGPFRAIPTSVPGTHICELLPHTARHMHRMALVRSINTKENDHGKGSYFMQTGRRQMPGSDYPHLGAVCAKYLAPELSPLPGYIHISPNGRGGRRDSAFLGPRYAALGLDNGKPPANVARPSSLTEQSDLARNAFRDRLNTQFALGRRTSNIDAYNYSYDQAEQLMRRQDLFDVSNESASVLDRYGAHDFGRHCLLARRLLENGVTFVKLTHSNYDTHFQNFDFHIEQLGEFDQPFATLLGDLADRGMLESTLVIVMSEFGRTPKINRGYGRDHWGTAWSVALAGCGIQPSAVIGKTNDNGTAVAEREVDAGHLFHTYFRAVGLDPTENHDLNGRAVPIGDPAAASIQELLA